MKGRRFLAGFFFRLRHLPGGLRRFRYWIMAGLVLIFLAVIAPWVNLLGKVLGAVWGLVRPVLDNPVGRLLVVNAILIAVAIFLYRRYRDRGRKLVGAWAVDRFLAGLLHLSAGRYRRAARSFEAVLRVARWVELKTAAEACPEIAEDARIKCALCYRELGDVPRAMRSLEMLKVRDLSPTMRKELAEAKAFVYSLSGELMEETVDREIANALELDPQNRRLLRLRRERAEKIGDLAVAVEAQKRLVRTAPPKGKAEERSRLAVLHARAALRFYRDGRVDDARIEISRSRASDPGLALPNLLAGDMEADGGDARAAIREWARTPSLPALERIRGLLGEGRLAGEADLAFLADAFPRAGVLLLLAEHYLTEGKLRRAGNCVTKFEDLGHGNRYSAHLLAEIRRREGDRPGAERLEWRALRGFLGADASGKG